MISGYGVELLWLKKFRSLFCAALFRAGPVSSLLFRPSEGARDSWGERGKALSEKGWRERENGRSSL